MAVATVVAALLSGCSGSAERARIEGVAAEFCLPLHMVPSDIAWIPDDNDRTPQGFTIVGCAKRLSGTCSRLAQIVSADVAPKDNANFFGWKDFKKSALARRLAGDARTEYEVLGRQLTIKNEHVSDQWLILARQEASGGAQALPLDGDVVVAACSHIGDFPLASRARSGRGFGCYRHAIGPQYSIDYRFVTDSEIPSPEELAHLDENLFSQIEEWKCPVQ